MKPATILSILVLAVLAGCATPPPPGELILTEEDLWMKRRPPPCPGHVTYQEAVTYSK